jgi:peptide/nickel transport system substrate-binding protein
MAAAVVGVLTVAGCSSEHATASASGDQGATLKIGTFSDLPSFDPAKVQLGAGIYINVPYDTLLRQDKAGHLKPDLATAWSHPDPSTWQFTLRKGVTFTDGTRFDSAAVKANIKHMKSTAGPNQSTFADIASVDTPSANKVVVHFTHPDPAFAFDVSTSKGAMASPQAIKAGTLAKKPVGTGGWTYDASKSQSGVKYVFDANPKYWDKPDQKVQTVEIDILPDNNARVNALKTGAVDMIDAVLPPQIKDLKASGEKIITEPDQIMMMFIGDRNGKLVPALADSRVRKALELAINRKTFLNTVDAGKGDSASTIFPPQSKWYNKENASIITHNIKKAKSLLAKAGHPNGFSMKAPVFGTTKRQNEAVAQQLAKIGVKLNLVTVSPGTAGQEYRHQKFPIVFGPVTVANPYDFWTTYVRQGGGWDPFDVKTSKIDKLAKQAAKATSVQARKKLYGQMDAEILRQGLFLTLGHTPIVVAASPKVKGDPYIFKGERQVRPQGLSITSG